MCSHLPEYCISNLDREQTMTMKESKRANWEAMKEKLRTTHIDEDEYLYNINDLEKLVRSYEYRPPILLKDIVRYNPRFLDISTRLKTRDVIKNHEETRFFLRGLDDDVREEVAMRRKARNIVRERGEVGAVKRTSKSEARELLQRYQNHAEHSRNLRGGE